jgi:transcriptional regulator with XRE-family HTH domain
MQKRLTKDELSKKYSQKSKEYRFKHNLNQSEFARLLGIDQSLISTIENQRCSPPNYFVDFLLNN